MEDFKINEGKSKIFNKKTDDVKRDVSLIIDSILDEDVYTKLISFHYDLDVLLSITACLLTSPFLTDSYLEKLYKNNEKIPWHVVLDSLQRYKYKNFYDENSFILNVFDNNQSRPTLSNTLIRIRLLQILRHRFKGVNKKVEVGSIIADMLCLGYSKSETHAALSASANQRLIVTGRLYNAFHKNVSEVIPQSAIIFYLDYLIFSYRYIQNILPVTNLPFDIPMDVVNSLEPFTGKKLKRSVDPLISKFINYIKLCETEEINRIEDREFFGDISRNEVLSETMKIRLNKEVSKMKRIRDVQLGGLEYI